MKKWVLILLSLTLTTQAALAGPAVRCEGVLLSESWAATKWIKEYRLNRHEKAFESAIRADDQTLTEWVEQLFILQYGKRIPLKDYIVLSKDERAQNLKFRMWQERTVVEGFQAYAEMMGYRDQVLLRQKVKTAVKKSMKLGLQILSLPFIEIRDAKVTADQLTTWILEGTERHQKEMTTYLTEQSRIEGYNHVKSIMNRVILLTLIYFMIANWDDNQKEAEKQIMDQIREKALKSLENQLPDVGGIVFHYIQEDFLTMLAKYRQSYGEEPTTEEIRAMIIIAYKDYGITIFPEEAKP